jgi:hypothetical protein
MPRDPKKHLAWRAAYRENNREKLLEASRRYNAAHPHRLAERRAKIRAEFFAEYGSSCVGTCDGEACEWSVTTLEVLTIGHLFNDGKEHRKRVGGSGSSILGDLRKRGWPKDEGIAPQCANCQLKDRLRYNNNHKYLKPVGA